MNTEERDHNIMANTDSFNKFLTDLRDMIDAHLSGVADAVVAEPKKSSAKPSAKVDKEEVVEEATDREAELMKTNIRTLRKMAIELGFDEDEVADADKETLVESIIEEGGDTTTDADADADEDDEADVEDAEDAEDDDAEEDAEEDEEEEDEDDEEDDEEAEGYTREDLEGLTLAALKKIAKEEFEETTASLKGLDTDDIIDLILGEGDEEEEEDEDEEEGLTEEDLEAMSLAEVKAVAKDNGVAVKAGMKKADIIEAIFA